MTPTPAEAYCNGPGNKKESSCENYKHNNRSVRSCNSVRDGLRELHDD